MQEEIWREEGNKTRRTTREINMKSNIALAALALISYTTAAAIQPLASMAYADNKTVARVEGLRIEKTCIMLGCKNSTHPPFHCLMGKLAHKAINIGCGKIKPCCGGKCHLVSLKNGWVWSCVEDEKRQRPTLAALKEGVRQHEL
jgi:hypothetical protein